MQTSPAGPAATTPLWFRPSMIALVVANLIPLAGVLFLRWEVFPIVLLFWMENVIVGVFNALKMLLAGAGDAGAWGAKVMMIPFFCFHYGMFCLVHGVFVFALFGGGAALQRGFPNPGALFEVITRHHLGWAVLGLAVSHGVSFATNYLRAGEFRQASLPVLMQAPYARVIVLHVAILAGGFLVLGLGSPAWALALLVLLKIGADLRAHLGERRRFADGGQPPGLAKLR